MFIPLQRLKWKESRKYYKATVCLNNIPVITTNSNYLCNSGGRSLFVWRGNSWKRFWFLSSVFSKLAMAPSNGTSPNQLWINHESIFSWEMIAQSMYQDLSIMQWVTYMSWYFNFNQWATVIENLVKDRLLKLKELDNFVRRMHFWHDETKLHSPCLSRRNDWNEIWNCFSFYGENTVWKW